MRPLARLIFFLSSRRRHTIFKCGWSSDVCSSDLGGAPQDIIPGGLSPSDWVQSVTIADPSGHLVQPDAGNLDVLGHYCPDLKPPGGTPTGARSEERRVGKEGRSRWSPYH